MVEAVPDSHKFKATEYSPTDSKAFLSAVRKEVRENTATLNTCFHHEKFNMNSQYLYTAFHFSKSSSCTSLLYVNIDIRCVNVFVMYQCFVRQLPGAPSNGFD